ncbi:MAG TPA: serine protease [Xanthobacteraceae bacterium]|nr:serine protease [Xanthobacteraceae bacterium]
MRFCVALLAVLIGILPASAQQSAVQRPVLPSPAETYAAMPPAERIAIQSDLLWAGHYEGVADGDFTERSIAAVRAFQRENKTKQTGILNPKEREVLAAAAKKEREAVGWRVVEDAQSGSRVGFPAKLLPQWVKNKLGSRWSSERGEAVVETFRIAEPGASLAAVFNQHKQEPERKVETSQLRSDSFVMTGLQGLKKFYARAEYKNGEVRGLTVLYDQAMHGTMAKIVGAVWGAFVPFSNKQAAVLQAAEAKGKVEYATGMVVSAAGHILTPRHVIEGCAVITLPGLGNTETVAEDPGKGLALLRVYGNRQLSPLPFSTDVGSGPELTLVGVADPKAQSGGSAASTARAKLGAVKGDSGLRALDGAPVAGFSGAAVLDSNNRLLGMVQFKAQLMAEAGAAKLPPAATVIPVQAIRDFLAAEGVTPPSGNANEAKSSVVRVICVRR